MQYQAQRPSAIARRRRDNHKCMLVTIATALVLIPVLWVITVMLLIVF
jgi:hypothetical protein